MVVFHDHLGTLNAVGLLVVILGVLLFNWYRYRRIQAGEAPAHGSHRVPTKPHHPEKKERQTSQDLSGEMELLVMPGGAGNNGLVPRMSSVTVLTSATNTPRAGMTPRSSANAGEGGSGGAVPRNKDKSSLASTLSNAQDEYGHMAPAHSAGGNVFVHRTQTTSDHGAPSVGASSAAAMGGAGASTVLYRGTSDLVARLDSHTSRDVQGALGQALHSHTSSAPRQNLMD